MTDMTDRRGLPVADPAPPIAAAAAGSFRSQLELGCKQDHEFFGYRQSI